MPLRGGGAKVMKNYRFFLSLPYFNMVMHSTLCVLFASVLRKCLKPESYRWWLVRKDQIKEFCFCFYFVLFLFSFEKGSKELCFCFKSFVFLSYFHTSIFGKLCFAKSRIKTFTFHVHFY